MDRTSPRVPLCLVLVIKVKIIQNIKAKNIKANLPGHRVFASDPTPPDDAFSSPQPLIQ